MPPFSPFTGPWCLVYPNARVMGRDRRCCWEHPGKLMWRPAPSRPECFLFKVIKSSDHRESGSHRSADERIMKHKHEVRQRCLMFDAHQEIPFLHAAGRRTHDLSSEIFIKVHLFNSSFHSLDPNTPSIHKEKHTPLFLIGYFTCGCPMKCGGRSLSDNNRHHHGDEFPRSICICIENRM